MSSWDHLKWLILLADRMVPAGLLPSHGDDPLVGSSTRSGSSPGSPWWVLALVSALEFLHQLHFIVIEGAGKVSPVLAAYHPGPHREVQEPAASSPWAVPVSGGSCAGSIAICVIGIIAASCRIIHVSPLTAFALLKIPALLPGAPCRS